MQNVSEAGSPHHPANQLLLQTEMAQVSNAYTKKSKVLSDDDVLKVPLRISFKTTDTITFNKFQKNSGVTSFIIGK